MVNVPSWPRRGPSRLRLSVLFALLLAVLAAPAGLVLGDATPQPYVVMLNGPTTDAQAMSNEIDSVAAAAHITATGVYAHVGAFSADLSPGQLLALQQDPAVGQLMPDQRVSLDDGTAVAGSAAVAGSRPRWPVHQRWPATAFAPSDIPTSACRPAFAASAPA